MLKDCAKILCDVGQHFRMVMRHIASTGLFDDRADLRPRPAKVPLFKYRMRTDSHQSAMIDGVTLYDRTGGNGYGLRLAFCEGRRGESSRRCSAPFPLGLPCLATNENGSESRPSSHRGQEFLSTSSRYRRSRCYD